MAESKNILGRLAPASLKRGAGRQYRRAQRALEHATIERGLQSTWTEDVSSGYFYVLRGLWGRAIGREDVLLDYGAGRGRALLVAARFPFRRVIGLELDAQDAEIARSNARIAASRLRCSQIEVITGDASVWAVPDDVTYIYMFNPFWGETFAAVLERVLESLDRCRRPLTIVYANPKCAEQLLATGRFERIKTSSGPRWKLAAQRVDVFRSRDPAS